MLKMEQLGYGQGFLKEGWFEDVQPLLDCFKSGGVHCF